MEIILTLSVILLVIILTLLIYVFFGRRSMESGDTRALLLMQKRIEDLSRTLDIKLTEANRAMQEGSRQQFRESRDLIQEINREMNEQLRNVVQKTTEVSESSKQVFQVADQLKELQNILKNPKQRGVLGEYYLETVLQNVMPPESFQMQFRLGRDSNGSDLIVDAAVFVKGKVIPIDSKFSLENYNRFVEAAEGTVKVQYEKSFLNDLKSRISETAKYIQPALGTMDFAFMFIPHEGIYYDLLSNRIGAGEDNLIQRAAGRHRVIIVSPTSFLAYLQTVLQGLKALEIEEKAGEIINNVDKLSKHISQYEEYYEKLGASLCATVNYYNSGYKELGKVDKDILKITGDNIGIEAITLDKPQRGEY